MRIARDERQNVRSKRADEIQQLERIIHPARAEVRTVEQSQVNGINFRRRGRRPPVEALDPQGDVIRMGVEILRGMEKSSKG